MKKILSLVMLALIASLAYSPTAARACNPVVSSFAVAPCPQFVQVQQYQPQAFIAVPQYQQFQTFQGGFGGATIVADRGFFGGRSTIATNGGGSNVVVQRNGLFGGRSTIVQSGGGNSTIVQNGGLFGGRQTIVSQGGGGNVVVQGRR